MHVDIAEPIRLGGAVAADQVDGENPLVFGQQLLCPCDDFLLSLIASPHPQHPRTSSSGSPDEVASEVGFGRGRELSTGSARVAAWKHPLPCIAGTARRRSRR